VKVGRRMGGNSGSRPIRQGSIFQNFARISVWVAWEAIRNFRGTSLGGDVHGGLGGDSQEVGGNSPGFDQVGELRQ
jgi:hypothetical protein